MKTLNILLLLIFVNIFNLYSQEIKGKVIDKQTSEAIPGAVVEIPEINKGTVTNDKGFFELKNLPKNVFKLQVKSLGDRKSVV